MDDPAQRAAFIRDQLPKEGLFAGHEWRVATEPFSLKKELADELEKLGRVLLQFYRAANLLYRQSTSGKQPDWVADCLDLGKPSEIISRQRNGSFKNNLPAVFRPDILLTEEGWVITELDSVPGGMGLTAWLNHTYSDCGGEVIGGRNGMTDGFASIFENANNVHVVVSEESRTYRPEMKWLCSMLGDRFSVRDSSFTNWSQGDAVYRFFELFDLANVNNSGEIFKAALSGELLITPPPKAFLEEKMLLAFLWNRNLRNFWQQELGGAFYRHLLAHTPQSWVVNPEPLPPHAAIPGLDLTDWRQLADMSQRERNLVLKISGFSDRAWGARGLYVGSDLSGDEWARAVDRALSEFSQSPWVLQRYHKPRRLSQSWFDFDNNEAKVMDGRVRLCPYYFVTGKGDAATTRLGGILATVCPANKKVIHGMPEAVLTPCAVVNAD
jgi:hypothetical protein